MRSGWDTKYVYGFSWLGRPIIQLPEDMIRFQELVYKVKPDVILEIGVAHGGSVVFSAGLCKLLGKGRVVAVDIEIRPHNRKAIEEHELFPLITMIEGDSIAEETVDQVRGLIRPGEVVLACLDGCHTYDHVMAELKMYAEFIPPGSYILAMDGIIQDLAGAPRSDEDWATNNPAWAARDFVAQDSRFVLEEPGFPFSEGQITERVTYWPDAFLKRV